MEAVTLERDNAKKQYDDLRKTRLEEFMVGFSAISSKLKEMYQVSVHLGWVAGAVTDDPCFFTRQDDYTGWKCGTRIG